MQYSQIYAAAIMNFLLLLATVFRFELPTQLTEVSLEQAIGVLVGLFLTAKILIERYRKGGVDLLGRKQQPDVTIDSLPDHEEI